MEKTLAFENSLKFQALPNNETIAYRSQISSASPQKNLILIHGWISSSLTIWDDLVELLSDLPVNIYAIDLRGFGDSSYNKSIVSMKDFSTDVHLFVEALALKNVVVAGYSMGGAVILQYAADYPEDIEKLISFNGVGCQGVKTYYEDNGKPIQIVKTEDLGKSAFWGPVNYKWSNDIAGAIAFQNFGTFNCGKKIDPARVEKYVQGGIVKERHVVDALYWLTRFNISKESNGVVEGTGEISKIKCKCLFIHTDNDVLLAAKDHAEITANTIGKPLARVEIIENSGHCAFMSNPEKTAEVVRGFLNEK